MDWIVSRLQQLADEEIIRQSRESAGPRRQEHREPEQPAIIKPAAGAEVHVDKPAIGSEKESEPLALFTTEESERWSREAEEWRLAMLEAEPAWDPSSDDVETKGKETADEVQSHQRTQWTAALGVEVEQLYGLLKFLGKRAKGNKTESDLRDRFRDECKLVWDAIDRSKTLTQKDRKDFFGTLAGAGEQEFYQFIADLYGNVGWSTVKRWRFTKPKT